MASQKSSVKESGGGGFEFADSTAALFLAHMLGGGLPLGADFGQVAEIHFEVRDRGWLLDDLLLVSERGDIERRCALSLKSNNQVTQSGFPAEFVVAVWEQWKSAGPPTFTDQDLLVLGTARIAETVKIAWDQLLRQAMDASPDRLISRLHDEHQSSLIQRRLFSSLHCPSTVCPEGPNDLETATLIRCLRVLVWDFETEPSADESAAVVLCRSLLTKGDTDAAIALWSRLQNIAAKARATGASHNVRTLLKELRSEFELKNHPNFEPDLAILRAFAEEMRSTVRSEIGQGIRISRRQLEGEISEKLAASRVVALRGESGAGKSVIVTSVVNEAQKVGPVIWLDGVQFDWPSQTALSLALNLRHTIPELITASATKSGLVVLDSLERFSPQAIRRAAELIRAASDGDARWIVIITCQSQMWDGALRELFAAGVRPTEFATLDITPPAAVEIIPSIGMVAPGVASLLFRTELQSILCNLKVLDWVITEDTLRSGAEAKSFLGESDVIDWIWERWIGSSSGRYARAGVLIRIAEHEGRSFGSLLNVREFSDDEKRTLRELEDERLVRVRDGSITFTHDLLGDWARLHSLLTSGLDAIVKIQQIVSLPRWNRAVRLYAQRMLEHDDGPTRWKEAIGSFQGESSENVLAVDSFLDALIFAGNAEALLEQVWSQLTANNGQLLCRFLKRFLHIATVPDLRISAIAEKDDLDWIANRFRIPFVLYWYAPLRILNRHADDVCRLALILAADICELWLRTIPPEWRGGYDAARLAVKLAKEAQGLRAEWDNHYDKTFQKVFEALLHAARDLPDEVSQISLELCHRRDESPDIIARVLAHKERLRTEALERQRQIPPEQRNKRKPAPPSIFNSWHDRQLREPAADGPKERVDESFLGAVLDSGALISLAHVRPAVAREVLLAVCIDEPKPIERGDILLDRDCGTGSWPDGYPPMFFRGPFLQFLRTQPEEALEVIIRLVNYATTRWEELYLRNAPPDLDPDYYSLELSLPRGTVRWHGVPDAFVWYRDIQIGSNQVVSALMALEKWLYEEIDEGRSIEQSIERIFERSSSIAFAGLLIAIGIRTPALLAGPLRPLLAPWRLYYWQVEQTVQDDTWRIGLTSWARFGERIFQQVIDWNSMPHRKRFLRDVARELFLTNNDVRQFFDNQRPIWSKELETNANEELEMVVALFDSQNYVGRKTQDGQLVIEFDWPEHLREKMLAKESAAQSSTDAVVFPHTCRRILEGEQILASDNLDQFWTRLQSLANRNDEQKREEGSPNEATIIAGGIAVIVTFHRSWLRDHPEAESWCLKQLRDIGHQKRNEQYSPHTISDTATESFLAEAAFALIPEIDEEWLREIAAFGITAFYYSSTRLVLKQAFQRRSILLEDFGRAINLMTYWSGLRMVINHAAHFQQPIERLERMKRRLILAFVKRTLPTRFISLERIGKISRKAIERIDSREPSSWRRMSRHRRERDEKVYRDDLWLDTKVISSGFSFLGFLSGAVDESDRERLIRYHAAIIGLFLSTMPKLEAGEELDGTPYEFDRWVLQLCTALIPQLPSTEARSFWQPIMDIGPGARYWIEDFFHNWFMTGLQVSPSLETFGDHWKDLIAYSLDSPRWAVAQPRASYLVESCTREMMGLGMTMDLIAKDDFVPVIQSIAPLFQEWAQRWLNWPDSAISFSKFLSKPAGRALLPNGIIWLNRAVQAYSSYQWRERHLDESLAAALRTCWKSFSKEVSGNLELRTHFLELLNTLCKRLGPDALALRTQVSQFMPDHPVV